MDRGRRPLLAAILGTCLAMPLFAQNGNAAPPKPRPDPRAYGTTNWSIDRIGSADFAPMDSRTAYAYEGTALYSTDPDGYFQAAVHVPTGAFLQYIYLDYCANVTGGDVWAWLYSCPHDDPFSCNQLAFVQSIVQVTCTAAYEDLSPNNHTVNNNTEDLYVQVQTKGGFLDSSFSGVSIYYSLQMSPAPATATFADVPTNYIYFRAIEALAAAEITSGCGGGNFCPNQAVTRGEMAKFLAVALGLDWHP